MAEVVIAVIAVVGGIVAIAVVLAWLKGYDEGYEDGYAQQKLNRILETRSIIDAEPVKHGHWISKDFWIECSYCNIALIRDHIERTTVYPNGLPEYCPCCGAKMDGGADNGS